MSKWHERWLKKKLKFDLKKCAVPEKFRKVGLKRILG